MLVLRDHGGKTPAWVPNPLSHRSDEVEATVDALRSTGFDPIEVRRPARGSPVVIAVAPR